MLTRRWRSLLTGAATLAAVSALPAWIAPQPAGADTGGGCQSAVGCAIPSDGTIYQMLADQSATLTVSVDGPLDGGCAPLAGAVPPAERGSAQPPAGVPGDWGYRVCGDPPAVRAAVATGSVTGAKAYCADHKCAVVVLWASTDPNYREQIPAAGRSPDGFLDYFPTASLKPAPASSPLDGKVFVTLPTWFYDGNTKEISGAVIGGGGFIGTGGWLDKVWWTVDGQTICNDFGSRPPAQMSPAEALRPSPDCGFTFTAARAYTVVEHKDWKMISWGFFGPSIRTVHYAATLPVQVREVQTLGH